MFDEYLILMKSAVIPSGSLNFGDVTLPHWAKPTIYLPIDVGCLAKVLPLGGSLWMNELVVVLEVIEQQKSVQLYKVFGRFGEAIFPHYALDVQSYKR